VANAPSERARTSANEFLPRDQEIGLAAVVAAETNADNALRDAPKLL
jgi:hypothetical protein